MCGSACITTMPVQTSALTPSVGTIGTLVALTRSGFTSDNTIHFGSGVITHVPVALNPACLAQGCMVPSQQMTPGDYAGSVENANGTSDALTFTVSALSRAAQGAQLYTIFIRALL